VPDLNRGSAFVVIFMMSALQVIAKAASVALLAVTGGGSWLLRYVVADHALHFIYRIGRNDAVVYFPMPPAMSYMSAPVVRVIMKTICDFTGGFTFRLPLMIGGSYWLFNLAMSQASVFVCVHLYLEYADDLKGGAGKIEAGALWTGAGGLAAGWLITFTYECASERSERPSLANPLSRAAISCSASRSPSTGTRSGRGRRGDSVCTTTSSKGGTTRPSSTSSGRTCSCGRATSGRR
jgi:hypothetical protein